MPNKMLIDASHPEETRVVVVRGNRIEEFDFESQDKKQLKGNIYLARVTRVEPSLQAAFVEYGGNRHGFLAFSEIHPDYYQIPVADRQALLKAEAEAHGEDNDDEDEGDERGKGRRRRRGRKNGGKASDAAGNGKDGIEHDDDQPAMAQDAQGDVVSEPADNDGDQDEAANGSNGADNGGNGSDNDEIDTVGAEDAIEEAQARRRPVRRQYKIQEVVKRRQILLVQVVKEERGNKGAALTTYLSLAGRYSVLMPNTARGGGISRKITSVQDRKRLKDIVKDLDVPQGMGVILRTAGESRTKAEIKRDYEYLMRMWENVRELTLRSTAPSLVYEEGSLIKRSIRDLYNKDISEIQVAGDDGYREAKDFMRMLMPSHAKAVQPYRDKLPIFARNGIEGQLDKMVQPQVTLKSGGYIIINQTEALVAIDVNSGRSTREHSIEDTALQTNLEAAEEVARQLRLRDLAGLIVIDFIDMEENRNNRSVEKRLKDCLKNDRARIQVGRISHFGLLEMSRQRIRASVLESTMQTCPHCGGAGHVRSESSVGLLVIRAIEEYLLKDTRNHITVRTPTSTALYVLNQKRDTISELETRFGLKISIEADETVRSQHYAIVKGAAVENPVVVEIPVMPMVEEDEDEGPVDWSEGEVESDTAAAPEENAEGSGDPRKKRRRKRRRGRDRGEQSAEATGQQVSADQSDDDAEDGEGEGDAQNAGQDDQGEDGQRKKRRRGKRGGRRNRRDEDGNEMPRESEGQDAGTVSEGEPQPAVEPVAAQITSETLQADATLDDEAMAAVEQVSSESDVAIDAPEQEDAPKKRKAPARKRAPRAKKSDAAAVAEAAADLDEGSMIEPAAIVEGEAVAAKPKRKAPARKTTRRKAADAQPAEAAPEQSSAQEAEAAPAAEADAPDAPAAEPRLVVVEPEAPKAPEEPAEPVVVSTGADESDDADAKPRKSGWWQRKSFF